jgi:hypothetical protein
MLEKKLTEQQLDALYMFLSISYSEMDDDEKLYWTAILMENDPDFDDDVDDEDIYTTEK